MSITYMSADTQILAKPSVAVGAQEKPVSGTLNFFDVLFDVFDFGEFLLTAFLTDHLCGILWFLYNSDCTL